MTSKFSLLISFCFLLYNVNAFDITNLLDKYPDFSTFNSYLTQTKLATDINSRQTITVLAVDNAHISPLSGKSVDVLRKIMSLHVVLDYFDVQKLQNLQNKATLVTTLFQASGQAAGQKGFLNVTASSGGSVAFGSAGAGSTPSANLVKSVFAEPYNISVLQISSVIVPLGGDTATSPSSSASTAPAASPTKLPTAATTAATTPSTAPTTTPATPTLTPPISSSAPSTAPATSQSVASAASDISPSMPPSTPGDAPEPAEDAPETAADAPLDATAPAEADTPNAAPDSPPAPALGSPPMPAAPTADAPAPAADSAAPSTTLMFHLRVLMIIVPSAIYMLAV